MMKNRTPQKILDEIVRESIPQDIDLSAGILFKVRKEKRQMKKSRIIAAGCVALLIFALVFIMVPDVALAVQRLFGYIPGAGLVDQHGSLLVLKEPVHKKFGDTTVSVLQGVADQTQTIVTVQIENLPASNLAQGEKGTARCDTMPVLTLPDGTQYLGAADSMDSWVSGYRRRIIYPALLADVNFATLQVTCLELISVNVLDKQWKVDIEFVDAPAELTVYPLVEFPTPTAAATVDQQSTELTTSPSLLPSGEDFEIILGKYIETADEIIFTGNLQSRNEEQIITSYDSEAVHLTDISGKSIALVEDYSLLGDQQEQSKPGSLPFVFHAAGGFAPGPATFTIDSAWVVVDLPVEFTFDTGENPQPGQIWELNQSIDLDGYSIVIKSAELIEKTNGYNFNIESPETIIINSIMDRDHPVLGGGGSGFTYEGEIPSGELHIVISGFQIKVPGPWTDTIELPALENANNGQSDVQACLTATSWQEAWSQEDMSLPSALSGNLMINLLVPPEYLYWAQISGLDGENPQTLVQAEDPSLSADGSRVVYSTQNGLSIIDVASGSATLIPGTSRRDRGAIWSPDGTKIAFTRGPESGLNGGAGPYQLMLMDADGQNIISLLKNTDANIAQAWAPDSRVLIYTVKSAQGSIVRKIDIQNGESSELFTIPYVNASVVLSPDGKQVAYEDMLPGEKYAVFSANLDGSQPRLLADAYPIVVTNPRWSPDGQWMIVSVQDVTISEDNSVLALIELSTCKVIPLKNLFGYVNNWIP
jgi:hypothetical protein